MNMNSALFITTIKSNPEEFKQFAYAFGCYHERLEKVKKVFSKTQVEEITRFQKNEYELDQELNELIIKAASCLFDLAAKCLMQEGTSFLDYVADTEDKEALIVEASEIIYSQAAKKKTEMCIQK